MNKTKKMYLNHIIQSIFHETRRNIRKGTTQKQIRMVNKSRINTDHSPNYQVHNRTPVVWMQCIIIFYFSVNLSVFKSKTCVQSALPGYMFTFNSHFQVCLTCRWCLSYLQEFNHNFNIFFVQIYFKCKRNKSWQMYICVN